MQVHRQFPARRCGWLRFDRFPRNVLGTALETEVDNHLGYGKHDVSGRGSGNCRNGTRTNTVMTEIGPL